MTLALQLVHEPFPGMVVKANAKPVVMSYLEGEDWRGRSA